MEIDLSRVIGYSKDSLQSRALMRSIMLDLYPGKTREMNVLLSVYESGIPRKIMNEGTITDAKYAHYIQKIVDDIVGVRKSTTEKNWFATTSEEIVQLSRVAKDAAKGMTGAVEEAAEEAEEAAEEVAEKAEEAVEEVKEAAEDEE